MMSAPRESTTHLEGFALELRDGEGAAVEQDETPGRHQRGNAHLAATVVAQGGSLPQRSPKFEHTLY